MTLSDKILIRRKHIDYSDKILAEDVKEFIRLLKEDIGVGRCWAHQIIMKIDKLAGKDLI